MTDRSQNSPEPKPPIHKKALGEYLKQTKNKGPKFADVSFYDLVGLLPEEIDYNGEQTKLSQEEREVIILDRMNNLRQSFFKMESISYDDNSSGLEGKYELRPGKQLTLYPKQDNSTDETNISFLDELNISLNDLSINFWPDKDQHGNVIYIIENARDLEIIRRLGVVETPEEFERRIKHIKNEKIKAELRRKQELLRIEKEKYIDRIEKIKLEVKKSTHKEDAYFKKRADPLIFIFSFASDPVVRAEISKELNRQHRIDRNYKTVEPEETLDLVEEMEKSDDDFLSGRSAEIEFLLEKTEPEPIIPEIVNIYPKKYKWFTFESYLDWCKTHNVSVEKQKVKKGSKVLVNLENKEVVPNDDVNQLFIAAKDWKTNTDAKEALNEILLIHKNFIIWMIIMLKEKVPARFAKVSSDDLFQMGNLAIIDCVTRNDPSKQFSGNHMSFMRNEIEGEMRRLAFVTYGFDNDRNQVRLPEHVKDARNKILKLVRTLQNNYPHRKIDESEIAREVVEKESVPVPDYIYKSANNISSNNTEDHHALVYELYRTQLFFHYQEIDYSVLDSVELDINDVGVQGEGLFEPPVQFNKVLLAQMREMISKVLPTLSPREERVLRMRFGIGAQIPGDVVLNRMSDEEKEVYKSLSPIEQREYKLKIQKKYGLQFENGKVESLDNVDGMSLEEIGKLFGVNRERIRQIERKALSRLKHPGKSRRLRGLLDSEYDTNPPPSINMIREEALEKMKVRLAREKQESEKSKEKLNGGNSYPPISEALKELLKHFKFLKSKQDSGK